MVECPLSGVYLMNAHLGSCWIMQQACDFSSLIVKSDPGFHFHIQVCCTWMTDILCSVRDAHNLLYYRLFIKASGDCHGMTWNVQGSLIWILASPCWESTFQGDPNNQTWNISLTAWSAIRRWQLQKHSVKSHSMHKCLVSVIEGVDELLLHCLSKVEMCGSLSFLGGKEYQAWLQDLWYIAGDLILGMFVWVSAISILKQKAIMQWHSKNVHKAMLNVMCC
jgi:hypothetical protein